MKTVTSDQMREIDKRTIEEFSVPGLLLMEHAGKALATAVFSFVKPHEGEIAVICGHGNNGGDGLVAARHLYNKGYAVDIFLASSTDKFKGDALTNLKIIQKLPIPINTFTEISCETSLIIDALLGTGIKGNLSETYKQIISSINKSGVPVISADIPSGLDADSGKPLNCAIKASMTVTMGVAKIGLIQKEAKDFVGQLVVAEIGIPRSLLEI